MAGGLAHEISNPLAIIHGRASDLRDLAAAEVPIAVVEVRTACDSILKTAERASSILRGLRGFAREANQDPMALASIYDIADESLELQQSRFDRNGIEVRVALDAGIPPLLCRETQIGQILTNLLNNAFDAIVQSEVKGADRWMGLTAASRDGKITVEVTDSGPGVADHFKAHLMEPFFTTKELGLGMGVGLSLSRAIAQDHGGTLMLCSDRKNTCFQLVLPITQDAAKQEAAKQEAEPAGGAS
jgi:C4-dicarboxylate-specific signal transduction histidine kinase